MPHSPAITVNGQSSMLNVARMPLSGLYCILGLSACFGEYDAVAAAPGVVAVVVDGENDDTLVGSFCVNV